MTTHIVLWNLQEPLTPEQKSITALKIKSTLEPLKDIIPGVLSLKVIINDFQSSNRDIALIAEYESVEALNNYITHPAHIEAGKYIRSVTCDRACLDY